MKAIVATAAIVAGLAAAPASATLEVLKFYAGTGPGSTLAPTNAFSLCDGSDRCSNAAGSNELDFSTLAGGLLKVTALGANGKTGVVIQDLHPDFGGLGVYTKDDGDRIGDDNIENKEKLTFTFAKPVPLTQLVFFNEDHGKTFATGEMFGISVDGGLQTNYQLTNIFDHTFVGSTFTFYGIKVDHKEGEYYVSAMTIPEPSTYALLLSGLAMIGFMARRRRAGGANGT